MRWLRALTLLFLLALAGPLAAQQADLLTGRITDASGQPISGVRVEAVSSETEIARSVLTDRNGRYTMLFPDGGGRYVLRASFIGFADITRVVTRAGTEELLVANLTMTEQAIPLAPLTVTAQRGAGSEGRSGDQTSTLSRDLLKRLPLPDIDPNTLALLIAGVSATTIDSLSERMGFSVAGMSDLLNVVTLDGVIMGQGGLSVPEEGLRRTQVTTSTFDAARGGFAGGLVSMQSARGNNRPAGSFSYMFDNDALQATPASNANLFLRHNVGGSYGGPLIDNKLFYNVSMQFIRNTNYMFALGPEPLISQRAGVAVDSIARFLNILNGSYGLPVAGQTGAYDQFTTDTRLSGRVDWNVAQRATASHTLSVRYNQNIAAQDSTRIRPTDLTQRGGEGERDGWLAAATLSSMLGGKWTNALNLSFSEGRGSQLPYTEVPEGLVRVTSVFDDGTRQNSALSFGGNRGMPQEQYNRDLQLANDLSFLQPIGNQIHRLKVGGLLQRTREDRRNTDNLFGTFTFNSLADFAANRPDSYERSLVERQSRTDVVNAGLYVGDTWRISNPLEVTLGVRWDRAVLEQKPARNPRIEELFGRRTDFEPSASGLSPRLGFTYQFAAKDGAVRSLNGGIGLFAGRAPISNYAMAARQTGLPDAEQRVVCVGSAVPVPDWNRYLLDPLSIPTQCIDNGTSGPVLGTRAPNVALIATDQSMPSSLRFDVGYQTPLPRQFSGNFRYTYARGIGLWGYRDINLDEQKSFTLAGEDRPFYGERSAIVAATGAVSPTSSRRYAEFSNVLELTADRESSAHQFSATVLGMVSNVLLNANYTLSWVRDQGSGPLMLWTTAGNPNEIEWASSSGDRRHTLNLMMAYPVKSWLEVSALSRFASGLPFTPMVERDINGDGLRNDRAFVFDPRATGDTAVANGMTRLLANVPGGVRECLQAQTGRIVERNSCRNPAMTTLDVRLAFRPRLPTFDRRLTIALDARNIFTGIDQLVNGIDDMRGWGQGRTADATLLRVRGFDAASSRFQYQVNEAFGQTQRGAAAFGAGYGHGGGAAPFSITLSGRVAIGGIPAIANRGFGQGGMSAMITANFDGAMGGGDHGGPGGLASVPGMGDLIAMVHSGNPAVDVDSVIAGITLNPVEEILTRKTELGMSAAQVTAVQEISDSLDAQFARRRAALQPTLRFILSSMGTGGMMQLMQQVQTQVRPQLENAARERAEAMRSVARELSPQQWEKLPANMRGTAQRGSVAGLNPVATIDRMLANPIPLVLMIKDSVRMDAQQVTRIEAISERLQETLNKYRERLGKRFNNVPVEQRGQTFQQMVPDLESAREEIRRALQAVEKALGKEQWQLIPERIRNPMTGPQR